jgi:hypothetical protein
MNAITGLEFRVLQGEDFVRIDRIDPASLVDAWVARPRLSCCSFQGGLFVDIDDKPWSDDGCVDEFPMTLFWFHGIAALDAGATTFGEWTDGPGTLRSRFGYGPWEESNLALRREGDGLAMVDVHHSGSVSMRRVVVDYTDFVRRVRDVAAPFASLLRACRRVAMERLDPNDEKRKKILDNVLDDRSLEVVDRVAALSL